MPSTLSKEIPSKHLGATRIKFIHLEFPLVSAVKGVMVMGEEFEIWRNEREKWGLESLPVSFVLIFLLC